MSTAFAERERDRRGLEDSVEIITGGTHPADSVHDEVVTVMQDHDIDLSDRTPREVSTDELESCDVVATMGCSTLELDAEDVDVRDWHCMILMAKTSIRSVRSEMISNSGSQTCSTSSTRTVHSKSRIRWNGNRVTERFIR